MKKTSEKLPENDCLCEVTLSYQPNHLVKSLPTLSAPDEVYAFLKNVWDLSKIELQEEFYVLLFNNALKCIGWSKVSSGGKSSTIVEVSQVVTIALLGNADSVVLAHNHPSGHMRESTADLHLTTRISKALSLLGIKLNDHLIISRDGYISFKQRGKL